MCSLSARAVSAAQAVEDITVVILSIPMDRLPAIASLITGKVESLWVIEQLGRPVVKAWNSLASSSPLPGGGWFVHGK
jgi:hypothetical protein